MAGSKRASVAIAVEAITSRILLVRAHKVILDADLASLYGVETRRLNEQVKRNIERFPEDFMFRLTRAELDTLNRSQIATGSQKHRDPRFTPFAFTEHGAIQAANVLNSPRAIEMGVYVVRAFVQMREVLATHKALARKLTALEQRIDTQDETIFEILDAIKKLMAPPEPVPRRRPIGFVHPQEK
ncbi:MAG: ORF6N domain-containing protein [Betaproteobacteria bacterium]|nr:ORF6N domain-containing protein [Betaproteobacteria bacterium]